MAVVAAVVVRLILHTNVGDGTGFDGGSGVGNRRMPVDDSDFLFVATVNIGLLLLLLLHALNLELGFDGDDDDDSFEDPDSDPCAFPLPAFKGAARFFLVGC